jgi:hypothetical protein
VKMAWARHATGITARWILYSSGFKSEILSDRQALLNCLPGIWSSYDDLRYAIWKSINPAFLDRPMLVEVLSQCENDSFHSELSDAWKRDVAVVRALLRSTMMKSRSSTEQRPSCYNRTTRSFKGIYASLSLELQLQCVDLLVQYISGKTDRGEMPDLWDVKAEVFHLREVAHAALSRGWGPSAYYRFSEAVMAAPWSHDPDFLLEIAQRHSVHIFWECCLGPYRRNKDLIMKAIKVDPALWTRMDATEDLKYDFDVLCSVLGRSNDDAALASWPRLDAESRRDVAGCRLPTDRLVDFGRELRRRLVLVASIEVAMHGIGCETSPLSLLDQDVYTRSAFQRRLAEWLGTPSRDDNCESVAILRSASNALSRYGF